MASPTRVAVLDDYQHVALSITDWSLLKDRITIDVYDETLQDEDALVRRLEPYPIICAMRERTKFPPSLLDRLPNLKLIATTGTINRGIDVVYAKSKGIIVSGTSGKGNSTLEHIWALLLATVRYVAQDDANVKAGNKLWQNYIPLGISSRVLGLVGVGHLGTKTANIAKAFGMRIIAWSPHLTPDRAEQAGVEYATREELFEKSDIVSIHMVLSDSTYKLIGANDIARMKSSAFLINTSRGPLVDEDALVNALSQKKIAGAGLDVFDIEPLPLDHPLRKLDNVTLTPHTGYVSDQNYEVFFGETVDNIASFLDGNPKRVIQ